MRRLLLLLILFALPVSMTMAQQGAGIQSDSAAIKQAVLDFVEGYYSGDVARMDRAICPDINRVTPRNVPQTGRTILTYSTYSSLIETTRAKQGALADTARHIQVQILDIFNDVANVKLVSAVISDYMQLVRLDNQWRIINAIATVGAGGPRIPDFNPQQERPAIERAATDFLLGQAASDGRRLELTASPDFNRITLNPIAATGKTSFRRQRYDALLENTMAGTGKLDEVYRDYDVSVVDMMDGLALVKARVITTFEFLQMFKSGGQWKVLNGITKTRTDFSISEAMTVTVGDQMPDFKLPIYGGGDFTLSKYRGKNVMLIFPRGWIGTLWCPYCPYQYLELEQLAKQSNGLQKYNLQVAFVMPYSSDRIKDWMEKFPDAMNTVEAVKNPDPKPAAKSYQEGYVTWARKQFPKKFDVKKDDPHTTIPVLVDEQRTLSRSLKIFTRFWDGISSEQNVATALIIDKNGVLRFKYISQMTEDRPSVDFLLDQIKALQ